MRLVNKINALLKRKFSYYSAINNLDRKMERYLNYKDGFFVEIGANDGISQSNTFFLEKKYNWCGLLIEPSEKFKELIKVRSSKNFFSNSACCSFENSGKLIKFSYNNLMTVALNLESDLNVSEHTKNAKDHNKVNYEFKIEGTPLNNLLIKYKAPKLIDFFSLDVEGVEYEVLTGIDHSTYRFKYILVECRDFNKINNYLLKNNYIFIEKLSKKDYLFSIKD